MTFALGASTKGGWFIEQTFSWGRLLTRALPPGIHVIATARRPEVLRDLSDLGLTTLPLDVTNPESIAACKKNVNELTGGRLDFLVNNA